MLPPLAQNTSTTPISEPPATTPDATGNVNCSASFGFRLSSSSDVLRVECINCEQVVDPRLAERHEITL